MTLFWNCITHSGARKGNDLDIAGAQLGRWLWAGSTCLTFLKKPLLTYVFEGKVREKIPPNPFLSNMGIFCPVFPWSQSLRGTLHNMSQKCSFSISAFSLHSPAGLLLPSTSTFLCFSNQMPFHLSPAYTSTTILSPACLAKMRFKGSSWWDSSVPHKEKATSLSRQIERQREERRQASLLLLLRKCLFSVSKCVTGN